MTNSSFSDFPLQMEALMEDSIEHIISHEDPQHFIGRNEKVLAV